MKNIVWVIVANLLVYLLGGFIVWDMNPMNWWLFNTIVGRVFFILIEFGIIKQVLEEL